MTPCSTRADPIAVWCLNRGIHGGSHASHGTKAKPPKLPTPPARKVKAPTSGGGSGSIALQELSAGFAAEALPHTSSSSTSAAATTKGAGGGNNIPSPARSIGSEWSTRSGGGGGVRVTASSKAGGGDGGGGMDVFGNGGSLGVISGSAGGSGSGKHHRHGSDENAGGVPMRVGKAGVTSSPGRGSALDALEFSFPAGGSGGGGSAAAAQREVSEIDSRLMALQSFLDAARAPAKTAL